MVFGLTTRRQEKQGDLRASDNEHLAPPTAQQEVFIHRVIIRQS
jgi:hypothetical protein